MSIPSERTRGKSHNGSTTPFTRVPRFVDGLILDRKLLEVDCRILRALLRFHGKVPGSCWADRKTLMAATGLSEATVKRSLRRLIAADVIRRVKVPKPDPAELRNRTGWRIYFVWMDEGKASHACASVRELGVTADPFGDPPASSTVTPPPGHARPEIQVTGDPQTRKKLTPPLRGEKEETTTTEAAPPPESLSSSSTSSPEEKTEDSLDGLETRQRATKLFNDPAWDRKAKGLIDNFSECVVDEALDRYEAKVKNKKASPIQNPFTWIYGTCRHIKDEWNGCVRPEAPEPAQPAISSLAAAAQPPVEESADIRALVDRLEGYGWIVKPPPRDSQDGKWVLAPLREDATPREQLPADFKAQLDRHWGKIKQHLWERSWVTRKPVEASSVPDVPPAKPVPPSPRGPRESFRKSANQQMADLRARRAAAERRAS